MTYEHLPDDYQPSPPPDGSVVTDQLWQQVRIQRVTLRNRIFVSAHTTGFGREGELGPSQQYIDYLRSRARGGVGLIITEAVRVDSSTHRARRIGAYSDDAIAGFADLGDAVRGEGAALFAQLSDPGRHLVGDRLGNRSASAVPFRPGVDVPHRMLPVEIRQVARAFGDAAGRMRSARVDGIEIAVSHGHLLHQFLSPAINDRSDAFGGSRAKRLTFPLLVLDEVSRAARDTPIGLRVSGHEFMPGGLELADMLEIAAAFVEAFPIAFINVSQSAYVGGYAQATQIPDMSFGPAPFRHFARSFKEAFPSQVIMTAGRIDDLEVASSLVLDGVADLIGMTRAHIADPNIVRKARANMPHAIRSCIASNDGCIGRLDQGLSISCTVNPEVGLESQWSSLPLPSSSLRVLVVGGGPAGLEAATAAARRGHNVMLAEKDSALGGLISIAARSGPRRRLGLLTAELEQAARLAGVDTHLDTHVDAAYVTTAGFDVVVLATGSAPGAAPFAGGQRAVSAEAALGDLGVREGMRVAVIDADGGWAAASVVEHMASSGAAIEWITTLEAVAPNIETFSRGALFARLSRWTITVSVLQIIDSLDERLVILRSPASRTTAFVRDLDRVVWIGPRRANDELASDLMRTGFDRPVYLVGDAYAPRSSLEAVYDGRLAGSAIGVDEIAPSLLRQLSYRGPLVSQDQD